jgi:hypothetical protein
MRFEFEHRFAAPLDVVAATILDEDFQASLHDIEPLSERTVLEQTGAGNGQVVRRTRCVLGVKLPAAARKVVGEAPPAWVEEATWHPDESRWTWVIKPEVAGHLLAASGSIEFIGESESTLRRVLGRVEVRVPFFGGRVERIIVGELQRAYEEEARRLQARLS